MSSRRHSTSSRHHRSKSSKEASIPERPLRQDEYPLIVGNGCLVGGTPRVSGAPPVPPPYDKGGEREIAERLDHQRMGRTPFLPLTDDDLRQHLMSFGLQMERMIQGSVSAKTLSETTVAAGIDMAREIQQKGLFLGTPSEMWGYHGWDKWSTRAEAIRSIMREDPKSVILNWNSVYSWLDDNDLGEPSEDGDDNQRCAVSNGQQLFK